MKIQAIRIRHVKKIGAQGLALEGLSDGLNVLSEPNEFGKSTIFEAFRHGLLTKHSSKRDEILLLKPRLGGGSPLVEIDIVLKNNTYRIRKQFLSQTATLITDMSSGTIIKSADDAQEWIKQAIGADEKNSGPAGLLWVSQGKSFLPASQTEAQQEVFSSVLDNEVTSVVSGQRGRQVMSKVRAQLSDLVTKTGRPAKTYKAAEDTLKSLESRKQELMDKMSQAEAALTRLSALAVDIQSAQDPSRTAELTHELEAAESEHQKALQAAPKLEQLRSEKERQAQALIRASEDVKNFDRAVTRGVALQSDVTAANDRLSDVKKTLAKKEQDLQRLSTASKKYETAKSAAELNVRHAIQSAAAAAAKQRLEHEQGRLERAVTLRESLENQQAVLAGMPVDDPVLQSLRDLEGRIQILEASLLTGHTQFSINYETGQSPKIVQGGTALEGGKRYAVPSPVSLILPGIGRLSIEPAQNEDDDTQLKTLNAAKAEFNDRLGRLDMTSLSDVISAHKSRRAVLQSIDDVQRELARNAPDGIEVLKASVQKLTDQAKASPHKGLSETEAQDALNQAQAAHIRALAEEKTLFETVNSLRQSCAAFEAEVAGLDRELHSLTEEIGRSETWDTQKVNLQDNLTGLETQSHKSQTAYETFKANAPSLELTQASLERCKTAVANRAKRANALILEREGLIGQLQSLSADGVEEDLAAISGEIIRSQKSVARFKAEADALTLLRDTLEETQSTEKALLFGPVVRELKTLMPQVIQGADVRLGEDYAASEIIRDGQVEDVESLSGGTQEQIAILTRLAFARLKAQQGHPTPVILDDAIIFSDDARISGMFTALNVVAKDLQILVLTCRQKSFEGLGGHLLSGQAWPE